MRSGFLGRGIGPNAFGGGGGFTPSQLAGLQLWLKADAITGLADGAAIGTWADSSGNGRNATQGTAGAQPTYKTGIINSLPVARFDGGDSLARTSAQLWATSMTMIAVWQQTDASVEPEVFSNAVGITVDSYSGGRMYIAVHGVGAVTYASVDVTAWMITTAHYNAVLPSGSRWFLSRNGAALTLISGGATAPNTSTTFGVGYNHWDNASRMKGDIAEIIVYDTALSDTNRQAVEAYLSAKYGIALA